MKSLAELAGALNDANPVLDERERVLASEIYRLLALGEPVSVVDISARAGADPKWVEETLERWSGVFRDDHGRVVAFWGLAIPEMGHSFELDGKTLYTWCAWDPLFIAPLLGTSARVTSTCPVTGTTITLTVGPDGVRDLDPPQAVLSFLDPSPDWEDDVIEQFCHLILLFADREAGETWTGEHAGTFLLSVDEGFELGRLTLGRLAGAEGS